MANTAKTAIVTGASRGIGAGLVEAFLKRGYNVVANSRNITRAHPFAAAAKVAPVDGDIGDPRTAAKIVDTAISKFGRIDVLINNAGVFISEVLHRIHDRRLQQFSLHDACGLSVCLTARHKANVAAEIGQHHQRVNYPG
jgi:NAD(P)-dependent dehydrogenase (short-subunit alcohol dehydrogenase family)